MFGGLIVCIRSKHIQDKQTTRISRGMVTETLIRFGAGQALGKGTADFIVKFITFTFIRVPCVLPCLGGSCRIVNCDHIERP